MIHYFVHGCQLTCSFCDNFHNIRHMIQWFLLKGKRVKSTKILIEIHVTCKNHNLLIKLYIQSGPQSMGSSPGGVSEEPVM